MVVHPAPGHYSDTLVNAVMFHCKNLSGINGVLRPGIVHRIDKDTTGSVIICKNDASHREIAAQLKEHSIDRIYHAICYGIIKEDEGDIETLIGRSANDRKKMAVVPEGQGKSAITHYKVLKRFEKEKMTYVECRLETGRTHQIRVHMKHAGHTLFNDKTYGGDQILKGTTFAKYSQFVRNCFDICPRQALHAGTLGFRHPRTGEEMDFEAPLPADMARLVEKWREYVSNRNY